MSSAERPRVPRIEDPDDYEARQREFEAAGDEFLIDQERWYEEHHQAPETYSDEVRTPRGVSRGGVTYGVFNLNNSAHCASCGSKLAAHQRVIGRKEGGRWTILHYAESECRTAARPPQKPAQSRAPEAFPATIPPPVQPAAAGPLGRPCGICGVPMGRSGPLRFDHSLRSFVHKSCTTTS